MRRSIQIAFILLIIALLIPGVALSQVGEEFRTLVINTRSGKVVVMEFGDKTFIDLKRLVQIAHGSIEYEGNRILLTLPGSAGAPATSVEGDLPTSSGLTRDFMKAGIEEISLMREWASTLANAVQNGYPVTDSWVAGYQGQSRTGLGTASAAVSNAADRNGFQLLNNEFEAVQEWSNKLLEARKSMDAAKYALSPGALQSDPLSQKIVGCARFLGQMLASGSFQDNQSCH